MPLISAQTVAWRRFHPFLAPAAIALLAGLVEIGGQPARALLEYRRDALAAGQLWRLVTGHFTHLGPSHMLMNVAALAVLALVLQPYMRPRDWLGAGLVSALAIDAGLYWLHPATAWYVGLSGVLHGFWAAAMTLAIAGRRWDAIPLAVLLLAKLGFERFVGPVPLTESIAAGPVVTAAHTWGAVGGALWPLGAAAIRRLRWPL